MKKYDIRCRNCGKMNFDLLLEDSNGWMECNGCGCIHHVSLAERRRGEVSAGRPKQIPARPYAANGQM